MNQSAWISIIIVTIISSTVILLLSFFIDETKTKQSLREILPKAVKTAWWLIKITVSVSALMLLLKYFEILPWFSKLISPVFNFIGLPGEAALSYVAGYFVNVYSAIAVMVTLDLSAKSLTILAVMILASHTMITETAIQKKTGSSAIKMVIVRTSTAFMLGFLLNLLIPGESVTEFHNVTLTKLPFIEMFIEWLKSTTLVVITMIVLIVSLSILQRLLYNFGVIKLISKALKPVMIFFGLPVNTAFLWIVANVVGLGYGAAIMMEERESGEITEKEVDLLNHHIAISHSNLEDLLLMTALGASFWWLLLSRWLFSLFWVWELKIETALINRPRLKKKW